MYGSMREAGTPRNYSTGYFYRFGRLIVFTAAKKILYHLRLCPQVINKKPVKMHPVYIGVAA
jgi:hypothetical protein